MHIHICIGGKESCSQNMIGKQTFNVFVRTPITALWRQLGSARNVNACRLGDCPTLSYVSGTSCLMSSRKQSSLPTREISNTKFLCPQLSYS
jgi:hypothetical protein